ncbi:DUF5682 family protein [Kineococcus sp. NBC_00420]|uniref:DUF5682 family protein n=1 Tax=Kineococcus sp. NBC_00420 TaxID=2903564 RepID=UPI003FA59BBB
MGGNAGGAAVVEVLGVRHHGPGSARAVRAALERLQPDVVLIEGPADADPVAILVADPGLVPPVALLAHVADTPGIAAFWPFAVFSPEWQALVWAREHAAPVRFCDLPSSVSLAQRDEDTAEVETVETPEGAADAARAGDTAETADTAEQEPAEQEPGEDPQGVDHDPLGVRRDPLAALAAAGGYDDPERWWEDVVESRLNTPTPFSVLTEAMAELRAAAPALPARQQLVEERREAHMRQVLRGVLKDGAQRVAVVCGAWHAPALSGTLPSAASDARLLRGLPKRRTSVTWVPWTHSRLAHASGYGAGIASPGWYHHLFTAVDEPVPRWLTKVAGVLRAEDLPVSSAHVIEAVRLADTLAILRGRPLAGLAEVTEATRAVLAEGDDAVLALITDRLVVGEAMGCVPDAAPTVPLAADLRASAKRLRLAQEPGERVLELDLRKDTDAARSRLLHRLSLLDIGWGVPTRSQVRSTGTFREAWRLAWVPELAVSVVEASLWGTTVAAAASAKAVADASRASLPALTGLVERCLLADLPEALPAVVAAIDERAALDLDVAHLMAALPALVRAARYSDVRGTRASALTAVASSLLVRTCAALPSAVTSLDDAGAGALRADLDEVHAAVLLWEDGEAEDRWFNALAGLAARAEVHGLLTGRATRLLRDAARLSLTESAHRLQRALSVGTPAPAQAAWVEGFLGRDGLLLVHDTDLLALLDDWVCSLAQREFIEVLPLLRRTFGAYDRAERRSIGDAVTRRAAVTSSSFSSGAVAVVDDALASPVLRTAVLLLGGQA